MFFQKIDYTFSFASPEPESYFFWRPSPLLSQGAIRGCSQATTPSRSAGHLRPATKGFLSGQCIIPESKGGLEIFGMINGDLMVI